MPGERTDVIKFADDPASESLLQKANRGEVTMVEAGRQRLAAFLRCLEHAAASLERIRERLFAKHMLARGERGQNSFFVKLRWSRNDDGFDLVKADQLGDVLTHPRSRRGGRLRGTLPVNLRDRDKFSAGDPG